MSTTEQRIADALSAFSGGITMETSTIEKRFAEVRERGVRERRRRRGIAVAAAGLAAAAALALAFAFGDGVLGDDDRAIPRVADPVEEVEAQVASDDGFPAEGATYRVEDTAVPFTFTVPARGDVPGKWHYGIGPVVSGINLDNSPTTGHAMVEVMSLDETYDPARPWTEQTSLVPAPKDAAGWVSWLEATGRAEVTAQEPTTVDGLPATRLTVDVPELPAEYKGGIALHPIGPGTPGTGPQTSLPWTLDVEMTLIDTGDRLVLAVATGKPETRDQWLPLMRELVDSLQFG